MTKDELKRSLASIKNFTDYQRQFLRILYAQREGYSRQEISDKMFDDGHTHRLAGVLAAFSKKIVPEGYQNTGQEDHNHYLDTKGYGNNEKLSLSTDFRAALDELPAVKAKIL